MKDELLNPCFNCGADADDVISEADWQDSINGEYLAGWWLICECGLSMYGANEEDVRAKWDKCGRAVRAERDEVKAENDQLRDYLAGLNREVVITYDGDATGGLTKTERLT